MLPCRKTTYIYEKNCNEARNVLRDPRKRYCAHQQRLENPDCAKNQSDWRIRYRALLKKNDILYCTLIRLRVKIFKRLTTTCPISSTVSLFALKVKKENHIFGRIRIQSEEARWRLVQPGKHTSRHSISISHERISDNMSHLALLHWLKKGFINIRSQASVPFIEWTSSKER